MIGNSDYGAEMGKLANPANDAVLIAKTLKQVGVEVISVTNADQNKMKQAIKEFDRSLPTPRRPAPAFTNANDYKIGL